MIANEAPRNMVEEHESVLRLLGEMQDLIKAGHFSADAKLDAIHDAITEAIGGSPERGREFVQRVTLGMLED